MKHIIQKYRLKAESDSRIEELYNDLIEGLKDLNEPTVKITTCMETPFSSINVSVRGSGGFTIRHIEGTYQIGRGHKASSTADAYRITANLIGAIIYGSKYRDLY